MNCRAIEGRAHRAAGGGFSSSAAAICRARRSPKSHLCKPIPAYMSLQMQTGANSCVSTAPTWLLLPPAAMKPSPTVMLVGGNISCCTTAVCREANRRGGTRIGDVHEWWGRQGSGRCGSPDGVPRAPCAALWSTAGLFGWLQKRAVLAVARGTHQRGQVVLSAQPPPELT